MSDHEADGGGDSDQGDADRSSAGTWNGCEVDREDDTGDHDDRENSAQVVDRIACFVDICGHVPKRQHQSKYGERKGDKEYGPPVELQKQCPGQQGAERCGCPSDPGPQRDRSGPARA